MESRILSTLCCSALHLPLNNEIFSLGCVELLQPSFQITCISNDAPAQISLLSDQDLSDDLNTNTLELTSYVIHQASWFARGDSHYGLTGGSGLFEGPAKDYQMAQFREIALPLGGILVDILAYRVCAIPISKRPDQQWQLILCIANCYNDNH